MARSSRTSVALTLAAAALYIAVALPLLSTPELERIGSHGPMTVLVLASCALGSALIALSVIDAFTFELPDVLTLPLAAGGVLLHLGHGIEIAAQHLASAVAAFGLLAALSVTYRLLRRREGLGLGDAKLCGAAGAWLGLQALPVVLALAAAAALASVAIATWRGGRAVLSSRLPFGPYLAIAIWLVWLYGPDVAIVAAS